MDAANPAANRQPPENLSSALPANAARNPHPINNLQAKTLWPSERLNLVNWK